MRVKEYKIFKTAKKTAKENNLIISNMDNKILFDYTELNENLALSEIEKKHIKENSLEFLSIKNFNEYECFYGCDYDNFTAFDGIATFYCYRVYDIHGQLRYRIYQFVGLIHNRYHRRSIYDNFINSKVIAMPIYIMPVNDIEI